MLRLLQLRRGEARHVVHIALIGIAYAAAVGIGDDIAQSVFVARVGADQLPTLFLFKGLLDVAAAALYLPLTRNRSPGRVWRVSIAIYILTIIGGRALVAGGDDMSAYALYVLHECAWTILTIHWGVFILDAFDASQARRLFPLLFTSARLGGILAGATLRWLVEPFGAVNMLFVAAGFAVVAAALSFGAGINAARSPPSRPDPGDRAPVDDDDLTAGDEPEPTGLWDGWRRAASSPLVRAIAWSTAAMVLVRYGMRMVSIDEISGSFRNDEDSIAEFLGWFGAWANLAGAVLGVFVIPRILKWFGVGVANLMYAAATALSFGLLIGVGSLWAAASARFVDVQLKDALKSPLSTLFYGAEPPRRRTLARAFIFGAIIPVATLATAGILELGKRSAHGLVYISYIGLAAAFVFVIVSAIQNARWRAGMVGLLRYKLERDPHSDPEVLARVRSALAAHLDGPRGEIVVLAARGLASGQPRLRAVAEEVLAETLPRRQAHVIARDFVDPGEQR